MNAEGGEPSGAEDDEGDGEGHGEGDGENGGEGDNEAFEVIAYRAFVRKARQAAHQALYFLYHLDEWSGRLTGRPVAEFRPFALAQVRGLVLALTVPAPPASHSTTRHPPEIVIARWREIVRRLQATMADGAATVSPLRLAGEAFLEASNATGWGHLLHQRTDLARILRKHTTTLATALALGAGLGLPEQLRNLLIYGNRLGFGLIPFAFLGVATTVALGFRFAVLRVGRRAFWQPWNQAIEPEEGIARWPQDSRLRSLIAAGLLMKVGISAAVQAVAFLVIFCVPEAMHGSRTAAVTVSLATVLLMMAHVVDRWDFMDERPTRLMTIAATIGGSALGWFWGRYAVVLFLLVLAAALLVVGAHTRSARTGSANSPPNSPPASPRWIAWFFGGVYVMACVLLVIGDLSSRAGQWRSPREAAGPFASPQRPSPLVGRRVSQDSWPFPRDADSPAVVVAASGGGSRSAIYTALTLAALPASIRDHIQAISSVSGGSLASAAYIQKVRALARATPPQTFDASAGRAITQSVSDDFLLPTLAGVASPRVGRGESLERYWQTFLGTDRLDALAGDWARAVAAGEASPPFPLPLFNACTLDGHALVMSPLDAGLYRASTSVVPEQLDAYPGKTLTNVFDRDGIYALEDLLDDFDVRLTSAVRASANFPFGFPLISLWTSASHLRYSPRQRSAGEVEVELTDGGVLSNSGMWSLYNLLMKDPTVLDRLKRRGVLLIVIEASKMPSIGEGEHDVLELGGQIGDKQPKGQRLHRMMFENLRHEYGALLEILQVDLTPIEDFNVGTTWALDTESTRRLRQTFDQHGVAELSTASGLFRKIAAAATAFRAENPSAPPRNTPPAAPAISFVRPPGD